MSRVSMKDLLEAGAHFGHLTRRWNPKMRSYIYGERNGIHIIDLHQTLKGVESACDFIYQTVLNGGTVLFVGTKKQAQESVVYAAQRCGMFHVAHRWLGGMLTNFQTIRESINKLKNLREMDRQGILERRPKKEAAQLREAAEKLQRTLGGMEDLPGMPSALFLIDLKEEYIAVREARRLGIPVVAIVDTNCDPDDADYVIPGNDDAIRAIKLITDTVSETIIEATQERENGIHEGTIRSTAVDQIRRQRQDLDERLRPGFQAPEEALEAAAEAESVVEPGEEAEVEGAEELAAELLAGSEQTEGNANEAADEAEDLEREDAAADEG
ncbi:MAG: 30S ribosomal protein S2 [Armatimonadetes bacterium]|nr:30S ribosomal protein S2 [Armatimonadota bacterium]